MPAPAGITAAVALLLLPAGVGAARVSADELESTRNGPPVKNNEGEGPGAYWFRNDDVENVIPLPPHSYPEVLLGIHWMDQAGSYTGGGLAATAPDLAFSFGDPQHVLDPNTRTIDVDIRGPAWQWENSGWAYTFVGKTMATFFDHYEFAWREDFEYCDIIMHVNVGGRKFGLPKSIFSMSMTKQHPPADACPPPMEGATQAQIRQCAVFKRYNQVFHLGLLDALLPDSASAWLRDHVNAGTYYMFRIVDPVGERIQPYYDAYLRHANAQCAPDAVAVEALHVPLTRDRGLNGADGSQPATSFIHLRN